MSDRSLVLIAEGSTRKPVEAVLIDGVTQNEALAADAVWMPYLTNLMNEAVKQGLTPEELPEHWHWQWTTKAALLPPDARHFGIECGGQIQGMMIALTIGKHCVHPQQKNLPLVYVDYIAAAPWNLGKFLKKVGEQPRYREVGRVLMTTAITLSRDLGYDGRIGLHSLPQTNSFYENTCGMLPLGEDTFNSPHGSYTLSYYEMTPAAANDYIGVVI